MSCLKCNANKCTCETSLCINPLIYLFKEVFSLVGTTSGAGGFAKAVPAKTSDPVPMTYTLASALEYTLSQGISISNNKNICCPDCRSGIYALGNLTVFQNLLNILTPSDICCIEHYSTLATWIVFQESWARYSESKIKCCDTDFNEVVTEWIAASSSVNSNYYLDTIINEGIFEESSFNGYSGLGILFNFLQLNHPELTADDYLDILGIMMEQGVVVYCSDCSITISSELAFEENQAFRKKKRENLLINKIL